MSGGPYAEPRAGNKPTQARVNSKAEMKCVRAKLKGEALHVSPVLYTSECATARCAGREPVSGAEPVVVAVGYKLGTCGYTPV